MLNICGMLKSCFIFLYCRSISSIRGELVPYLVRKQFSKTTNSQKIKDDTEDQNQKQNDGSTNHGQRLHTSQLHAWKAEEKNVTATALIIPTPNSRLSPCRFLLSRAPHLITRRVSPPAGPGALLLERPPRWHERGLPWRKAPLLCSHYGPGTLLPRQHSSRLHRSKPTGESDFSLLLPGFLWNTNVHVLYILHTCVWVCLEGIHCLDIHIYTRL